MTAEISLLDRQREAADAARAATRRGEGPPWNAKAGRLLAAGWECKTRSGRRIWKKVDPEALGGFVCWYSEDMALLMQQRSENG